jgi:uracil-DNA glycosylase family 4
MSYPKDELCVGCALYNCAGPVYTEFSCERPDVLFIGEALGAVEAQLHKPMVGPAGSLLRHTLAHLETSCPSLTKFAISNIWQCKPTSNILPESEEPGEFCKQHLLSDLSKPYKVVVPLGGTALHAICPEMEETGITSVQGLFFTSKDRLILPMLHPSYVNRRGTEWRSWELSFDKLVLFLNTGKTRYIPLEDRKVHQAKDADDVLRLLTWVKTLSTTYKRMDCDIETTPGLDPWTKEVIPDIGISMPWAESRIICMAISWCSTEAIAFMWNELLPEAFVILKSLLEDVSISWGWYNGQFDTQHVFSKGINARIDRDGQLAMHEVDERSNMHALKRDSAFFLEAPNWEAEVKQYAPTKMDSYEKIPRPLLLKYNGLDTCHTNHLESVAREYMQLEGSLWHYENILCPAYSMLARARYVGMRVDMFRVKELQGKILPVMEDLTKQMAELSGNPWFNPNSYKDKLAALHHRGINVDSSAKGVLEQFEGDEFVDLISAYMQAAKMESTYLRGFVDDVFLDLRVHPNWRLPAENGRMRADSPPVLTMPRKAEIEEHAWKRYMKEIFVADPGTVLFQLDRKQSEVRCIVFHAHAKGFIEGLKTHPDADIHGEFTKVLYGPNYTKEQRVDVKTVVFGIGYNLSAKALALKLTSIARQNAKKKAEKEGRDPRTLVAGKDYKVWSVRDAQKFIDTFFGRMPEVLGFKDSTMKLGKHQGYLQNYFGLMRRWGVINNMTMHHAENEMVNFLPSSLSNDINLKSCAETMKQFGKYGVEMLVPVHDSGIMKIPKDSLYLKDEIKGMWEELPKKLLRDSPFYTDEYDSDCPFPVDSSCGERWSEL